MVPRARIPLLLALAAALLAGCYYVRSPTRPIPALATRRADARCLVILIPGLNDGPGSFVEHGFTRAIAEHTPCDSVAVDLTYRYYFGGTAAQVLHDDVLAPALGRGYREIWLIGTSMGALGAALLARDHAESITGIVMLSPFLGLEDQIAAIDRAGGLAAWEPPPDGPMSDATFTPVVWSWLRGYAIDPDRMPALHLCWADGERLEPTARTLAGALPEGRTMHGAGSHGWVTWESQFRELLPRLGIGRRTR
jgi:pimeloyl-ACP methyl ester carboxylesterase